MTYFSILEYFIWNISLSLKTTYTRISTELGFGHGLRAPYLYESSWVWFRVFCSISRGDGAERQSSYSLACSGSLWAGIEFHPPDSCHTVQIQQPFQKGNLKPAMQLREGASLWKNLNCLIISSFKVFITAEWINTQVTLYGKREVTVWCVAHGNGLL